MRRKTLPATAALVAAVLVGSLLTVSPAAALSCNNCVDSSDIVNESLGSADIGGNAIRSGEIADGQVYGADIANGAVGVADLHPVARAAAGQIQLSSPAAIAGGNATFDSFTVTPPGPGVLVVRVTGVAYLDLNATTSAAEIGDATIAVCTTHTVTSGSSCGNAIARLWAQDADNSDSFNETESFSLELVAAATSAAPITFYLNGGSTLPLFLYGGAGGDGATAVVQFAPAQLAITS